jgi:predicted adenylyl cyclase CyaB
MFRFAFKRKPMPVNIEIKAYCRRPQQAIEILENLDAVYKGKDHQIDTYFMVNEGRLKLREGKIENNLIYYKRDDQEGPKTSEVILYPSGKEPGLKNILNQVLGTKVIVDKQRAIYFIGNVKFHIDEVKELGSFLEIEAIGEYGEEKQLDEQCKYYMDVLQVVNEDLIPESYSDLLLKKK